MLLIAGSGTILLLIAPLVVIVPLSVTEANILSWPPEGFSLQWYERMFTDHQWTGAFQDSLIVASLASVLATVIGTFAALGLVRGRFPGKGLVNALMIAPLIVPSVVIAIGFFAFFAQFRLQGSVIGLVIAHACHAIPYVVINVGVVLRTIDRNLEYAAANLGANPPRTFTAVTLPLILPGVVAGALFAFASSWDEVVVASFMTSPGFRTLPVRMFEQVQFSVDPTVAAVSTVLITVSMVLLLFLTGARRRGIGS